MKIKPRIMQEPGEVTNVIDAFDSEVGDPFDFSLTLGFHYTAKRARILRESATFEPGLTTGGFTAHTQNVGQYVETTSKLIPQIEVGIFRDLAFIARIPIVLANSRKIEDLDDTAGNLDAVLAGAPAEGRLFSIPFNAPDRSGVEYIALGLDLGIFNQARDYTKPTWVFGAEARVSAGTPMHACNEAAVVKCAHPGDVNQNGNFDQGTGQNGLDLESSAVSGSRDPGVTRGTVALEVHSTMSKRIKYVEPYGGFSALFEFQQGDTSEFGETDLQGALVNHPPLVGGVTMGMMVIPWENRENFGRLTFDVRFQGEYHSEGRDYSELFDALGSSNAPSLRIPRWAAYRPIFPDDPSRCDANNVCSVVDTGSTKTYFNGLTVVEPYGSYRLSGSVTWQPSEFVKLNFGLGYRFEQAHGISHDQPCNPDFTDNVGASGPCHSRDPNSNTVTASGIPNPAFRPTINAVGNRFSVDESQTFEVFAKGVVMF